MPGPRATPEYAREAATASALAMEHLSATSERCLDEAERQSRYLDDNHVGTEHIVLAVMTVDPDVARVLARNGVTEELFRAQLFDEPGPSPAGRIPFTPRAQMILGFARLAATGEGHVITPKHLMLGVIAESRDWQDRGFDGPHHFSKAATTAGTSLAALQKALSST
ncbi:MAG TPA: Clp protease N-terminal domain-containing protein [Acidimicrobiales bacterium]|nr:Clp protease N-terminal domain-containing protein [Acidimicrobiales bacterium]